MSRGKNSEFDWDRFDPDVYHEANYRVLRDDDQQIIERVRDFFGECGVSDGDAVDVGAASNLYPASAMLPFSRTLTFYDRSEPNVKWLNTEISGSRSGMGRILERLPTSPALRGQLVVVENPGIDWFFQDLAEGEELTYFFPHGAHVVLGGSATEGFDDQAPDPKTAEGIVGEGPGTPRGPSTE